MTTIPQRELRNNVSDVLRRAEQGERFTITVSGRPVAELGPPAHAARGTTVAEFWQTLQEAPVDPGWAEDLRRMREEDRANSKDPWIAATTLAHDLTLVTMDAGQAALPLVRTKLLSAPV